MQMVLYLLQQHMEWIHQAPQGPHGHHQKQQHSNSANPPVSGNFLLRLLRTSLMTWAADLLISFPARSLKLSSHIKGVRLLAGADTLTDAVVLVHCRLIKEWIEGGWRRDAEARAQSLLTAQSLAGSGNFAPGWATIGWSRLSIPQLPMLVGLSQCAQPALVYIGRPCDPGTCHTSTSSWAVCCSKTGCHWLIHMRKEDVGCWSIPAVHLCFSPTIP